MNPVKIVLALIPFLVFGFLSHLIVPGWAALISAALALIVTLTDLRGGLKIVPLAGTVILAVFAVVGFAATPDAYPALAAYSHGIATLVLAGVILVTAAFAPFTASYAKQSVPREYWTSPTFVATNRRISAAWGGAVAAMGAAHLAAGALMAAGDTAPVISALVNWGIPVVAIVLAYKYTQAAAAAAHPSTASAGTTASA
ncbi:hypothetical protein [Microbacterium sp. 179-I 3D3 NHS]|uniref:hypothetical protein n=1 Tax=unclassified Microbacterium TaxID=2609290 RepID=UPI0039A38B04